MATGRVTIGNGSHRYGACFIMGSVRPNFQAATKGESMGVRRCRPRSGRKRIIFPSDRGDLDLVSTSRTWTGEALAPVRLRGCWRGVSRRGAAEEGGWRLGSVLSRGKDGFRCFPLRRRGSWDREAAMKSGFLVVGFLLVSVAEGCTKNSKDIGVCLHIYLERDFPAIQKIVSRPRSDDTPLLLDGPELENNCNQVKEVLDCFEHILTHWCYYFADFFRYRKLVESLIEAYDFVCDHDVIRSRFLVLLKNLYCLEEVRRNNRWGCHHSSLTENIWQQILRLEVDTSICPTLWWQRGCLLYHGAVEADCGAEAGVVYGNLSELFLSRWCSGAAEGGPGLVSILVLLAVTLS
ncbi:unnamed protein product [Darwinula stevensoni]|uniref:Uncharacterized protein n=1 Tax=Darwinula stevensoni TaxID=69355 RepID=A0A7R8X6U6_9CRUS|nr:unnamed protein product [Darwinula stevensoni]CAG0888541.1 unnamed protein product [Darwinula stevensoni]